jgi:hypothetical protein
MSTKKLRWWAKSSTTKKGRKVIVLKIKSAAATFGKKRTNLPNQA